MFEEIYTPRYEVGFKCMMFLGLYFLQTCNLMMWDWWLCRCVRRRPAEVQLLMTLHHLSWTSIQRKNQASCIAFPGKSVSRYACFFTLYLLRSHTKISTWSLLLTTFSPDAFLMASKSHIRIYVGFYIFPNINFVACTLRLGQSFESGEFRLLIIMPIWSPKQDLLFTHGQNLAYFILSVKLMFTLNPIKSWKFCDLFSPVLVIRIFGHFQSS
jgi:hypothetical protein